MKLATMQEYMLGRDALLTCMNHSFLSFFLQISELRKDICMWQADL